MINIRHKLFETNSSSVHSMTLLTQDEYDKWKSGDYYLDLYEGRVLTKEEANAIILEYINKWNKKYPTNIEEFDDILSWQEIYSIESYENYTEYFDIFEDEYIKNGNIIYAVGYYGRDG